MKKTHDRPVGPDPRDRQERERVEALREKAMDTLAEVSLTLQKLEDAAADAGVDAGLLEGTGDIVYEVAMAQLSLAEHLMRVGNRLVDSQIRRDSQGELLSLLVPLDGAVSEVITVWNRTRCARSLEAEMTLRRVDDSPQGARQRRLTSAVSGFSATPFSPSIPPGGATKLTVSLDWKVLEPGSWAGHLVLTLTAPGARAMRRTIPAEIRVVPARSCKASGRP